MSALADLTWPEVQRRAAEGATLVIPIGSTEQHGPHLVLTTDTDIAVALSHRLSEADGVDVVVAPAVAYGSSGEHAGFAGTLSIGQEALETLLLELCRSAAGTFNQVLLVSAHGGNDEPITRAVSQLQSEAHSVNCYVPRFDGDAHAGHTETSIQIALDPGRVTMDEAMVGDTRPLSQILPQLRSGGVASVSSSGVLGDPTHANAADGAALLDRALDELVEVAKMQADDTP